MQALRNIPIRRNLTLIMMLISGSSLLVSCIAFLSYEQVTFRRVLVEELISTAKMIGENSAAALSFRDPDSAEETLQSLNVLGHIVSGAIYNQAGSLFASYQRPGFKHIALPPTSSQDGPRFGPNRLELSQEIMLDGETIGHVYLRSDLGALHARWRRYAAIMGGVILGASLIAFLLSTYMQRIISEPITHLLHVIGIVGRDKDYSVRAVRQSQDELGGLIDGFNSMLAQIQQRDSELALAQENLERRVQERTRELQLEVLERQRSEEALRQTNQRFEVVTQATTDVIWDWDFSSDRIWWNEHFQTVFGYSAKDDVPNSNALATKIHPEDRPSVLQSLRQAIERGEHLWSAEYRFLRGDGSYAYVYDRGYVLHDEENRPVRMIGAMQDVSERKCAENELKTIHRQLLESSRQAGMAEVATGVLHNVGNVLNSVNVSATLAGETVKKSKFGNLQKVVALLKEHGGDLGAYLTQDAKGRQVPLYLQQLTEHLHRERQSLLGEVDSIRKNIEHIKEIVSMQQSYAKVSGLREPMNLAELVEDAIRLNAGALERHQIKLIREFEKLPAVNVDKHKVLQILVNLIRNAKYACDDSGKPQKTLMLRIERRADRVDIVVQDNGVGIAPENLTRIFSHGFTTRKDGHGFGLHSGALAAKELGGSLSAQSAGPGQGATFVLSLPFDVSIPHASTPSAADSSEKAA